MCGLPLVLKRCVLIYTKHGVWFCGTWRGGRGVGMGPGERATSTLLVTCTLRDPQQLPDLQGLNFTPLAALDLGVGWHWALALVWWKRGQRRGITHGRVSGACQARGRLRHFEAEPEA